MLAAHRGTRPSDTLALNHVLVLIQFKTKLANLKEDMHSLREFVKKNRFLTPPPFSSLKKKNTPLHSKWLVITTLLILFLFILLN